MKVLLNHPEPALLRGVAAILTQTLAQTAGEVWLISPWLRDVILPLDQVGHFRTLLGGLPDQMRLGELLARIAQKHALHVVTKPPGELVDFAALRRLASKLATRRRLLLEEDLQGLSIVEDLAGDFDLDITGLTDAVTVHFDTIHLGLELQRQGAHLYYRDKLHAKLLATPVGVLVGSANFTGGGLEHNEEVMLEVTDNAAHQALVATARTMTARSVAAARYRLRWVLEHAGLTCAEFLTFADTLGPEAMPRLRELLTELRPFAT